MKRYGKFLTDQTVDADEIIAITSGGIYTDEFLRARGFYPVVEVGDQHLDAESRIFKYTLVNDDEGGHIEQYAYVVNVPKIYSKLKVLMGARTCGFLDQFVQLLDSNLQLKLIWDASNVIEDNELLSQYLPEIGQALGKTETELRDFLITYCIAD